MEYTKYDPENGRILCFYDISEAVAEDMRKHGTYLIEGKGNEFTEYVDISQSPPVFALRPTQNTTQDKKEIEVGGFDFMTLSNLPVPCKVWINEYGFDVDDGIFEWGSQSRGVFNILIIAFPYLDWRGGVKVF